MKWKDKNWRVNNDLLLALGSKAFLTFKIVSQKNVYLFHFFFLKALPLEGESTSRQWLANDHIHLTIPHNKSVPQRSKILTAVI